jgi:ribosomal protein S27E
MARFIEALKAGVRGFREGMGPSGYSVAGRPVRCPHCGETKFVASTALLNSSGASLVNLDWLDPSATVLICAECGRIEWFAQEPERVEGGRL